MRRGPKILLAGQLVGLALLLADCKSTFRTWVPPETHNITITSDALFVRTSEGDYVDGYLAEYQSEFRKERMFIVLELPHYVKGERLIMSGRPANATVQIELDGRTYEGVPAYIVERASPNIPSVPKIPTLK
jgi:hypothetical protein